MPRLIFSVVVLVCCTVGFLDAQPPKDGGVPAKGGPGEPAKKDDAPPGIKKPVADGPPEFEAKFADDSLLKVVALDSSLVVNTKYGKLTVPLADVQRVEIGFRFPEGVEAKVDTAITALGAAAFRERETAERELLKFAEHAVPALKRAVKSTDPEVARRADSVLKKLTEKLSAEKLAHKDYDLVETSDIVIRGRIEPTSLKVRTKLFGETSLQLSEVRGLRSTLSAQNEFAVDAAKYGRQNSNDWFDTGIDVGDQALEISVTGTVDLNPQQPGQFIATPVGNAANGTGRPVYLPNGRAYSFAPGALIGRIGNDVNAAPFVVGNSYKSGRSSTTGRLYLKVAPSPWGIDCNGSYAIKVKIGG